MGQKAVLASVILMLSLVLSLSSIFALEYSLEFTQVGEKLVIKEVIGSQEKTYLSPESLSKNNNELYFVQRIYFNQSYDSAEIKLNLDKGVIIKDNLAFPEGYKVESDGQIISLTWKINQVKSGEVFAIFATLEDLNSGTNWILWALILFVALIIFVVFLSRYVRKKQNKLVSKSSKKTASKKEEYSYLLDAEKRIIELLKKADRNELWQKQIQNSTDFSKAKISRLVRNLESRGLVAKIPFGNTNKVRLK